MAVFPRPSDLESFTLNAAPLAAGLALLCLSACNTPPPGAGQHTSDTKSGVEVGRTWSSPPANTKLGAKSGAATKADDDGCCHYCFVGTPCGDECLEEGKTCDKPEGEGCACTSDKRKIRTFGPKFRLGQGQGILAPDVWSHNESVGDPIDGPFTLEMAFGGAPELADKSKGKLMAAFDTSEGAFECELYEDQAPLTVANFVGLARGIRPVLDPRERGAKEWKKVPYYDETTFHRVIAKFMIQGGDPSATGRGTPGYIIPDEFDPKLRHDGPGYMSMANRNPYERRTNKPKYDEKTGLTIGNTGSAQFFITVAATMALNDRHTIFGKCPTEIPLAISKVRTQSRPMPDKPFEDVRINKVTILRK